MADNNINQVSFNGLSKLKDINEIAAKLDAVTAPNKTMSENMFVTVFLPMFMGEENTYNVDLNDWSHHAGGYMSRVDVYGKDGKTLFTVPPIYDRNSLDAAKLLDKNMRSISEVVETAKALSEQHPNLGTEHRNAHFANRLKQMANGRDINKDIEEWNNIAVRYGRQPLLEVSNDKSADKGSPQSDIEFDSI